MSRRFLYANKMTSQHLTCLSCVALTLMLTRVLPHLSVWGFPVWLRIRIRIRISPAGPAGSCLWSSQLTSGEMADVDGSDASPPESRGEFLPTTNFTLTKFYVDELWTKCRGSGMRWWGFMTVFDRWRRVKEKLLVRAGRSRERD